MESFIRHTTMKQQHSKGLFCRRLTAAVVTLMLVVTILPQPVRAAITAQDLRAVTNNDTAKKFFGEQLVPESKWSTKPSNPGENTSAKDVSITVESAKGPVTFRLAYVRSTNSDKGNNTWDYYFKPTLDGKTPAANVPLAFVYRKTTDSPGFSGFVIGDAPAGLEVDPAVADLENFRDKTLAKDLLDQKANDDLFQKDGWAKEAMSPELNKVSKDGLFNRDNDNDPFAKAVKKVAEIINSLNASIVSALRWTMDLGNMGDISGLSTAWMVLRNLVNILFVLILVVISLATMLRIDQNKFSIRSTLPLLVFAVLAVNFSLLFATILNNSAYVLASPFANQAEQMITTVGGFNADLTSSQSQTSFGAAVVLLVAAIIVLIALLILLFFFIIRIMMLWLLAAASPVMFLALVLPITRGEAKKIMQTWIKWVYMAPVAFVVLFIGTSMIKPLADSIPGDDSGANAILRAIFFAGLVGLAALIPLELGGRLMNMAGGQGRRLGKLGGKGGLGLAGALPLVGTGMSVGEAARTGKGFIKQRGEQQEQRAAQRAAGIGSQLHENLGRGRVATALTGRDITQAQTVTEQLVDKEMKDLQARGFQVHEALGITDYLKEQNPARQRQMHDNLSAEQRGLADSYIGRRAATKMTAEQGWWDWSDVRQFGDTGYQSLVAGDPLLQHAERRNYGAGHQFTAGDIDQASLSITMSSMDGEAMRKLYTPTWDYLDPNSQQSLDAGGASAAFRQTFSDAGLQGRRTNLNALRQGTNARHRNNMMDIKRERIAASFGHLDTEARRAVLSGMLDSREDRFIPLAGGPQTYPQAQAQQPPGYVQD